VVSAMQKPGLRRTRVRSAGFTLIELLVVMSIMGILLAIALPNYRVAVIQAREAVLKENLFRMRDVIDQHYADKGRYPESFEALVEAGYLRHVPVDPMTQAADWQTVDAEAEPGSSSNDPPGIYDVHSASTDISLSGTAYSEW
jgi:general secretion pathway protein G